MAPKKPSPEAVREKNCTCKFEGDMCPACTYSYGADAEAGVIPEGYDCGVADCPKNYTRHSH